ncbi:hypothetical protein PGN35_002195 [Nodosilinea sp. PGN35]|uniref:hypothetical protein n=1 Tax=Nodosilinea sp. PGN35 TaxID=3020489 RepID=UPI0023B34217|nr:hypothetical protein [Nodosilinea sp. TSF1-S3]MDF0368782.1 hypothetical protein [Nodosilinea sp. TSF1-S3]
MKRLTMLSSEFLRRLRTVTLVCLAGLISWLAIASQPAYAANADRTSAPAVDQAMTQEPRDQAYEEALEVIDDPNGVQKNYQENLKQFRQENPSQKEGLVEEAKGLVDKVTPGRK